jgi:hypothetical protein
MDKNIDSLKKNKEIDTMLHGWEEIKQMLLEVSPVFTFDDDKKTDIVDASPYISLKRDVERLDLYFNHTILNQFKPDEIAKIFTLTADIYNKILHRNPKKEIYSISLDAEAVNIIKDSINKLFEIFKSNPFSAMFTELFGSLRSDFNKDRNSFQRQIDELLQVNQHKTLSAVFRTQVRKTIKSRKNNLCWFTSIIISAVAIIFLSLFIPQIRPENNILSIINALFSRLLMISPLIWIAYFRVKNFNEDKRLEHEYINKMVMAQSYEHYIKAIDNLRWTKEDEDNRVEFKKKLLEESIKVLARNPTEVLSKDRNDDYPMMELMNKLIEKILDGDKKA